MGEESQPSVKAASALWGETCGPLSPRPGKGEESGRGREDPCHPRKRKQRNGWGGGGEQVELLEKSMELGKATERLKGLGAS